MVKTTSLEGLKPVSNSEFTKILNELRDESKLCLESKQFNDFVFRPELLSAAEIKKIDIHLAKCSICKAEVDEVKNNIHLYSPSSSLDT